MNNNVYRKNYERKMAKATGSAFIYLERAHKKRPGVISKCKSSKLKSSKHYKKAYRGQGRA